MRDGKPARDLELEDEEQAKAFQEMQLLSAKPVLYVCNVEEESAAEGNSLSGRVTSRASAEGAGSVIISAALEAEIAMLDDMEERVAFLADVGLEETGYSSGL